MRITIPKLFELFQLPKPLQGAEPLVAFVNGAVEQIAKALQSRLTLRDNAYVEIRELTFAGSGSDTGPWKQTFTPAQRTVEGILLLQTQSIDTPEPNTITSWAYRFLSNGSIEMSVYARAASTKPITAKFAVLFQ